MPGVKYVDEEHPRYTEFKNIWAKCRTVVKGSEAVKKEGTEFLPKLSSQGDDDYYSYLRRAVFYETTTRTVVGLTGMLFSREPEFTPDDDMEFFDNLVAGNMPMKTFLKQIAKEVLTTGRVGLLVDVKDNSKPYITQYVAEDIIDWRTEMIDGKLELSQVRLHEIVYQFDGFHREKTEQYRVLRLVNGVYVQEIYKKRREHDEVFDLVDTIQPTQKGSPINRIPFFFVNANGTFTDPSDPPLLGLVNMNIAHYLNSADYEHALHITGLPTPYVCGLDESNDLPLGSTEAWVLPNAEAKVGYLEFNGQGIMEIREGMKAKFESMIVLGSRLLETPKKASESADNQAHRKQGESAVLANIADSISEAVTEAVKTAAVWMGKTGEYSIYIQKDFITLSAEPEFLKQLAELYLNGLMSKESVFFNLRKFMIVPENRTYEEEEAYIEMIGNMENLVGDMLNSGPNIREPEESGDAETSNA